MGSNLNPFRMDSNQCLAHRLELAVKDIENCLAVITLSSLFQSSASSPVNQQYPIASGNANVAIFSPSDGFPVAIIQ